MERAASGRPVFTVIGGPNGAGKSTYMDRLAVSGYSLGQVVNPDVIAAVLPGPDATRDARAGRETLHRTRRLIASGQGSVAKRRFPATKSCARCRPRKTPVSQSICSLLVWIPCKPVRNVLHNG